MDAATAWAIGREAWVASEQRAGRAWMRACAAEHLRTETNPIFVEFWRERLAENAEPST